MPVTTILLIALAAVFALGFVFFKYFLGNKTRNTSTYWLAGFRFITVFILLLLIINPGITTRENELEKPQLFLAVDISSSINHIERADSVRAVVDLLSNNSQLQDRFDIQTFGFGKELNIIGRDTLEFNREQTNISLALADLEKISQNRNAAIVLITDGNQTVGENYRFYKVKENTGLFPVVVGDTTVHTDLYISNLNVNKYAFLNNDFPVEIMVNYSGNENINTKIEIKQGTSILFFKNLNFGPENSSQIVSTTLPASRLGTSIYEAQILPDASERNTVNNSRKFGVEVIDERTSVLILSSISHPDLGALKNSIEQNEQREATIEYIQNYSNINIADFELVIIYQPSNQFKPVFDNIYTNSRSYLLITGTQTDWNFLNRVQADFSKKSSNQTQEIFGVYNSNFSRFQFDDLEFERFPPLEDRFGILEWKSAPQPLLFQKLEGIGTKDPLLATFESASHKKAVLFGENIWKWRSHSFVETGSFESFDTFTGKLVQYLATTQKRDRLTFEAETVYMENELVLITAQFFDQNYVFNPGGNLEISLQNTETDFRIRSPMLLKNNRFQFETSILEPGEYNFEISEIDSGIKRGGTFAVLEFNIEQSYTSANLRGMENLADNNSSNLYFLNNASSIIDDLLKDNSYVTVQKSREKTLPLVDWKILLLLLVASLATEWFMRKYFGLI